MIELAFERAGSVRQPYPVVAVPVGWADTVAALTERASRLRVDRLSLQCRAVRLMLGLSRRRALELMEAMVPPDVPRLSCDTDILPDVRYYFETVGAVADSAFTPAQVLKGDQEAFLLRRLHPGSSALHVFAVAKLLADVKVTLDVLKRLAERFAGTVEASSSDDRTFSVELFHEPRLDRVGQLARKCESTECGPTVLSTFARYYQQQLSGPRCSDTFSDKAHITQRRIAISTTNDRLTKSGLRNLVSDVTTADTKFETGPKIFDYYQNIPEYRELTLRAGKLGPPRSRAAPGFDRNTTEFREEFRAVLGRLEEWKKPTSISGRDYFLIKSMVYTDLTAAASEIPELRERTVRSYLSFLELSETQRQDYAAEWLWRLSELIAGGRGTRGPQTNDEKQTWFAFLTTELNQSQSTVVNLYGQLRGHIGP